MVRLVLTLALVMVAATGVAITAQTTAGETRRQVNTPYAEYPRDALEKGIRGTVVVDVTVNAAGDVTTASVVSGPQELRATAFTAALALKYSPGASTTTMRINVDYTLSGSSWGVRIQSAGRDAARPVQATASGIDASGAVRIGGNIRPPRKIKDVPAVYPDAAREAAVQGVVILEARIDENGNVSDVRVVRSIPLLDEAAIDAVRQWQYTPTLLNGVAVPIVMTMTVNFTMSFPVRITMPDGTLALLRLNPNGAINRTTHEGSSRFGFARRTSTADTLTVTIYECNEAGEPQRVIGEVPLKRGAGAVQSQTTPQFGLQWRD